MASTESCQECEVLSAKADIARSIAFEEAAKSGFLHEILTETYSQALETAEETGVLEASIEKITEKACERAKVAAHTISALNSRVIVEKKARTSAELTNTSLRKEVLEEQKARKHEAKQALDAAEKLKSANASIKRLSEELASEKQRAEEAEQASREKDDAIEAAEQRQEEIESQLATERENLGEATERIEQLQEEKKSQQVELETAESNAQALQRKLEKTEAERDALQVKFDKLEARVSENKKQSDDAFSAMRAEFMAAIHDVKAQKNQDSVAAELKCTDLKEELATEKKAKADVINDLEASRQAEKFARDEVQQKQQELKQAIIDKKQFRTRQTRQSTLKKALRSELDLTRRKASKSEQHATEVVADATSLRTELTTVKALGEQKYAKLEQEAETLKAAKKQQEDAHSKLIIASKEKQQQLQRKFDET